MNPALPTIESYTPTGPLKHLVRGILYLRGLGTGLALQRVYQNIIINVSDHFHTSNPFENDVPVENPSTIWINGNHQDPFYLGHAGTPAFYVIAVKPGMLPFFISVPVRDTNDTAMPAAVWGPKSLTSLREQLLSCNDIAINFKTIEHYFSTIVKEPTAETIRKITFLAEALPTHTVTGLCHAAGYTRKRLWQEVLTHFGSPVKKMQGIIRFDSHLAALAQNSTESLSTLHGFYDQAHFIHDFKGRTGLTPKQYRQLCIHHPDTRHHPNFIPIAKETFLQFYHTGTC